MEAGQGEHDNAGEEAGPKDARHVVHLPGARRDWTRPPRCARATSEDMYARGC